MTEMRSIQSLHPFGPTAAASHPTLNSSSATSTVVTAVVKAFCFLSFG